jgi:hypothetical protein
MGLLIKRNAVDQSVRTTLKRTTRSRTIRTVTLPSGASAREQPSQNGAREATKPEPHLVSIESTRLSGKSTCKNSVRRDLAVLDHEQATTDVSPVVISKAAWFCDLKMLQAAFIRAASG